MNRIEIIKMAREAGINFDPAAEGDDGIDAWHGKQWLPSGAIVKLIEIAQAAERATRCNGINDQQLLDLIKTIDPLAVRLPPGVRKIVDAVINLKREPAQTVPPHCMCPACKDGNLHDSDCAVHNMPAFKNGECDCK